jgi:hypothetical protein
VIKSPKGSFASGTEGFEGIVPVAKIEDFPASEGVAFEELGSKAASLILLSYKILLIVDLIR